jgi:gliding motility-associated lipoprotein GldD
MKGTGKYRVRLSGWLALGMAVFLLVVTSSCKQSYTPKPAGYLRIDYPEKSYRLYSDQPWFQFEIPSYATIEVDSSPGAEEGWFNISVPQLNGKIHLSYKPVSDQLNAYITDSRELVYKHTVKAQGIEETPFIHRDQNRFGMVYDLKGDVASAVQFFITDSTTHSLRGSLYFNCQPNRDSLNPVIKFMREDIIHMIETTQWKY